MTPRPIHRWKSFWLGVLVLGLISWAWRDSMSLETWASWKGITASNAGSAVYLHYDSANSSTGIGGGRYEFGKVHPTVGEGPVFAPLILCRGGEVNLALEPVDPDEFPAYYYEVLINELRMSSRADWLIHFPHWLLLMYFILPWSAFLAWRWRGMRRASALPLD